MRSSPALLRPLRQPGFDQLEQSALGLLRQFGALTIPARVLASLELGRNVLAVADKPKLSSLDQLHDLRRCCLVELPRGRRIEVQQVIICAPAFVIEIRQGSGPGLQLFRRQPPRPAVASPRQKIFLLRHQRPPGMLPLRREASPTPPG